MVSTITIRNYSQAILLQRIVTAGVLPEAEGITRELNGKKVGEGEIRGKGSLISVAEGLLKKKF